MPELVFGEWTFDISEEQSRSIRDQVALGRGFGLEVSGPGGGTWLYWTPGVPIAISDSRY